MLKVDGKYFISMYDAFRAIDDDFIELNPGQIYYQMYDSPKDDPPKDDSPKDHSCRNCGAPLKSCICEYCGTVY